MRGKPSVVDKLQFKYSVYSIDLDLRDNHIFIGGESATGKSYLWQILKDMQSRKEYDFIITFNYTDVNRDILSQIKGSTGKLFVIDNADVLLDDVSREYIAFNFSNQYIMIGRNNRNLMLSLNNVATIELDGNRFYLDYVSDR